MDRVRAHVRVEGRVQGVWFRASTREVAEGLRLAGWVRNLPGGEVEAAFEGPREAVEEAVAWCGEGPPGARVDRCAVSWEPPVGAKPPFEVRP